jgi:hypothetical protein
MSGAFKPLTAAGANSGSGWGSAGYRGDPMTAQEMAQLALSILLLPACIYIVAGGLTTVPWWAYLASFVLLLGLSFRFERFSEAMLACGRAAVTLIAIAAFCQVIPLANRAVLGSILVISVVYSPFATLSEKGGRLDEFLSKFVTYWFMLMWLLVLFIIGCRIVALWDWDSRNVQADAFWLLKLLAESLYDAGMDLWYQFNG